MPSHCSRAVCRTFFEGTTLRLTHYSGTAKALSNIQGVGCGLALRRGGSTLMVGACSSGLWKKKGSISYTTKSMPQNIESFRKRKNNIKNQSKTLVNRKP